MSEIAHSEITGKDYKIKDGIRILNLKQSTMYLKHGCKLLDLYVTINYNSDEPVLCFIFDREDSKKYYDKWIKHELM